MHRTCTTARHRLMAFAQNPDVLGQPLFGTLILHASIVLTPLNACAFNKQMCLIQYRFSLSYQNYGLG